MISLLKYCELRIYIYTQIIEKINELLCTLKEKNAELLKIIYNSLFLLKHIYIYNKNEPKCERVKYL